MAEYTREQYEQALRKAHKSGDANSARAISDKLRELDATSQTPTEAGLPETPAGTAMLGQMSTPAPVPLTAPRPGEQHPPLPAAAPVPPSSGIADSVTMGALGGLKSALTFGASAAKSMYLGQMEETLQREDEGLQIWPWQTREVIKARYEAAVAVDAEAGGWLDEKMDDLHYQTASWSTDKSGWIKQTIAQATGSTIPMLVTGPYSIPLTYMMVSGEVIDELKDVKTLTPEQKLNIASVAGVPLAALERLGLGAIFGKIGGKGIKKVATGAAGEAVTELLQEMGVIAIGASAGREYVGDEIGERAAKALVGGAGTGPVVSLPGAVKKVLGQAGDAVELRGVYGSNLDSMRSDERILNAYKAKVQGMQEAGTNEKSQPFEIMRTVGADMTRTIKETVAALGRAGTLSKIDLADVKAVLTKAGKGINVLEQADFDIIYNLDAPNSIKKPLAEALRDVNGAIAAGRDNKSVGPVEQWMRGGSQTVLGGTLAALNHSRGTRLIIGGSLQTVGRLFDTVMKTRVPDVFKQAGPRGERLAKAGEPLSQPFTELKGLYSTLKAGEDVTTERKGRVLAAAQRARATLRKKDGSGAGSFDRLIADETGLTSAQVDEGLLRLVQRGDIDIETHALFYAEPKALQDGAMGLMIMDMLNVEELGPRAEPSGVSKTAARKPDSGIANPASYEAVVRSAEAARDSAIITIGEANVNPEQMQGLMGLVGHVVAAKSKGEKLAILTTAMQSMDAESRSIAKKVISPLATYGADITKKAQEASEN